MKTVFFFSAFLMALVFLAGCQTPGPDPSANDYGFQTTTLGDGGTFAIKTSDALKGFHSVYLKSVMAAPNPEMADLPIEYSDMAALKFAFENAFESTMSSSFPLVTAPGADVMEVTAFIENVGVLDPGFGEPPIGSALAEDNFSGFSQVGGSRLGVGFLSVVLEVRNAQGELLATFKDRKMGSAIESSNGMTSWARVSAAFNRWCGELENELVSATAQ